MDKFKNKKIKNKKIKNIRFTQTRYICVYGCVENLDSTLNSEIIENYMFMKISPGYYLSTPRQTVTQRNSLANLKKAFPEQANNETLLELIASES